MARNHSVGMTHAEYQLFTIITRQGIAGASLPWLQRVLGVSGTRISILVNAVNSKLDGCRVKSDGAVYRVVSLAEASLIASMVRDPLVDGVYA